MAPQQNPMEQLYAAFQSQINAAVAQMVQQASIPGPLAVPGGGMSDFEILTALNSDPDLRGKVVALVVAGRPVAAPQAPG
jgi:hypothetical protein